MKCIVCSRPFTEGSPVFLLKDGDREVLTCSPECLARFIQGRPQKNFLDFRKPF